MPAIRDFADLHLTAQFHVEDRFDRGVSYLQHPVRKTSKSIESPKTPKKKKPSNAFFLYRSHVIANNLLPSDVTHQNDASRIAAQMWRAESQGTRTHFFALAEERKKQQEKDDNDEEPSLSPSSVSPEKSTKSSIRTSPKSPPSAPSAPYSHMPPTPKDCNYYRPIFASSYTPSGWVLEPVLKPEEIPQTKHDEPLVYTLSDEWSSPDDASSLSFSYDFNEFNAGSGSRSTVSNPYHFQTYPINSDCFSSPPLYP